MTAQPLLAEPIDPASVRTEVSAVLSRFLACKADMALGQETPAGTIEILNGFLSAGGKRLRLLLCVTGRYAAEDRGDIAPVLQAAASLEMVHAFALIHDDIMDNSATRRSHPTVRRTLARHHAGGRSTTAAEHLSLGAAILIGDLALAWSDELLHSTGLSALQLIRVLPLIDAMRTGVMYGQHLDLSVTGAPTNDLDRVLAITRYKTAKYTIERPLRIGATPAGADDALRQALTAYATHGAAFLLRDDLLGVHGNSEETGKPCLDDLCDGKHTVLIAPGLQHATMDQRHTLRILVGSPTLDEDDGACVRGVLTATGAQDVVEQLIRTRHEQALCALTQAALPPTATAACGSTSPASVSSLVQKPAPAAPGTHHDQALGC
ncbi:polyprenyl synthetase family protein [Streptomyces beigongshangae]|uniref:polyprenyl synthetase family protein n=1 Tax=Streptomyces beigongshangae TaxID=2841597 RepID=UPI0027E07113|nr:polyprenyl synthetase family protein [Streptomyces sp. REN17]